MRAVDAAVAAQQELELPVRMGIATGEAELREGDELHGRYRRPLRLIFEQCRRIAANHA